jgi:pimeloyl-ACP methyl ester carboxylesterase
VQPQTILLLHGFASSAQSTKAQYLGPRLESYPDTEFHAIDFNPTAKDFETMTVTGMINRLRQYILDHHLDTIRIIGSSMGALVGLNYAHRFGGVEKMLLLAPALSWLSGGLAEGELAEWERHGTAPVFHYAFEREIPVRYDLQLDGLRYLKPVPPPAPIVIVHGRNDDVVPIDNSRRYAADFPQMVQVIEVDSDHRLNDRLPFIWEQVQSFLLA